MTNGDNGSWVVQRAFAAIASAYEWDDYLQAVDERDLPSDEAMAGLIGAYGQDGRLQMRVARWGSGLEVTFAGQPPLRYRASAAKFAAVNADTELEFRDGGSRLVFMQGGAELDCTREPSGGRE